ncbi:nuclear factor NF-kappa-B p110 subunit isoform X2 [Halyomorpha halys]|uniref:nuclear factor NF-kappa-B p110 subunit isoform X2 n=1 Tax=Halyomorpha halys TaxID=286706 RepID=UPI0006D5292F|nr:nuclear factor NF-kappa-B p110 subunit-like isoform X2 [Halyomorpha halys]
MNYDFDDNGSLGYCSDPQFSPEHNINWSPIDHNSVTWVEFTEQPADYRYRYLKEKYHGHIVGKSSPATKKKDLCRFPKIKLNNYNGTAIVRVWLISTQLDKPHAHFHKLARKLPKGVLNLEPHDFRACEENNYEVTLDYLHIVHAVSNDEKDINVYRKKKAHIDSDQFDPPRSLPASIKDEKEEIKQIDKNQSVFYVQVFDEKTHQKICQSIISDKIKNLHNAETGALKIVNCSRTFGTCRGNDEVFIFVEKISKDVQVRFFRLNNKKERIWQALAIYGPQHVHHQLGIVFRTPKFEQNIEKDTEVFFELHRTNDGAVSDPISYIYKPHQDYRSNDLAKKRPRSPETVSSEDEYMPTVLSSYSSSKRIKDESMSPDSTTTLNQIAVESVLLDPIIYPTYTTNNFLQPSIEDEFSSLLNSLEQSELAVNHTPTNYIENNDNVLTNLTEVLYFDESNLFGTVRTDSVTSTAVLDDEDTDKDLLSRAEGECFYTEFLSAKNDSPGRFVGVTKSEVKSEGRKSSQSSKVDLLSAICLKKPIEEFVEVLKNTIDIDAIDYEGNSALHYAVRSSVEYLKLILERDDLNRKLKNHWGDDALLVATQNHKIDIVKLLLENDFEPNVHNSRTGETPLHLAVSNENHQMVELLLKHGADPLLDNHDGKSAYDYSTNCNVELRRIMHFLMQKSMFQKTKLACSNEASQSSPENDLVSKLNELTFSTS